MRWIFVIVDNVVCIFVLDFTSGSLTTIGCTHQWPQASTKERNGLWCRGWILVWRGKSWVFLSSGKREGSDSQGESLHKNFVPGLRSAENNQICSFVNMLTDLKSVVFSHQNKKLTDEQTSRQQIWFSGTLYLDFFEASEMRVTCALCHVVDFGALFLRSHPWLGILIFGSDF